MFSNDGVASSILIVRRNGRACYVILSEEGVTQGDPLSMVLYGLALLPLAEALRTAVPSVVQPWYADDAAMSGPAKGVAEAMELLERALAQLAGTTRAGEEHCNLSRGAHGTGLTAQMYQSSSSSSSGIANLLTMNPSAGFVRVGDTICDDPGPLLVRGMHQIYLICETVLKVWWFELTCFCYCYDSTC